jgi:hypothetical protein
VFLAPRRPAEELYDRQADPWQLNNLAAAPGYETVLDRFRSALEKWIIETDDQGRFPEDPAAQREILEEHRRQMEQLFGKAAS